MFDAYYKILGLKPNAPLRDVQDAFRRLASRYHPDKNPGDRYDEDMFKLLIRAYRALTASDQVQKLPANAKRACRRKRSGTRADRRYNWQMVEWNL